MSSDSEEVAFKVIKSLSKQMVKQGASQLELSEDVATFLARQLAFTMDLLKKGHTITPGYLALLLTSKAASIADLAAGKRYECGFAVLFLSTSLTKAAVFTTFAGPGHFIWTAAELLAEVYSADKACGVSAAVSKKVEETVVPGYMWLESEILRWISSGGRS